jgi:hypothetical protein
VFENKLFYTAFTGDSLKLVISDFNSGKSLKSFVSSRYDTIFFKSIPIIRNGESESERFFSRNIKTPEFFNKIKKGGLFVYVKRAGKNYEIVIGTQLIAEKLGSASTRLLATPYGKVSLVEPSPTNDMADRINAERRIRYLIRQVFEFSCMVDADNLSLADTVQNQFLSLSTRKSMFIEDKKRSALEFVYITVDGKDYFLNYNEGKKIFDVYEIN